MGQPPGQLHLTHWKSMERTKNSLFCSSYNAPLLFF